MKKTILLLFSFMLLAVVFLESCETTDLPYREDALQLPSTTYDYKALNVADNFRVDTPKLDYVTNDGATLGRVLFYDRKLSVNNKVACASCHDQSLAFSDANVKSPGFNNQPTIRNSIAIVNLVNQNTFFWDSRSTDLKDMVLMPIRDHIEMGLERLDELETKLATSSYYTPLFEKAYGSKEITRERIADAMSQFLHSMVGANSRYDQTMATGTLNLLTSQEQRGLELFNGEALCASCHGGRDFRGSWGEDFANIGLDMNYEDKGLGEINNTSVNNVDGVFKVPSLRNIALTAPYMHDGRFATLRDVVNHYNKNIQPHENLDWRLRQGGGFFGPFVPGNGNDGDPARLGLSEQEISDLIAFLTSLTDQSYLTDKRFADPFVR